MTPAFREKGLFNNKSNEKNARQATTTTVLGKTQANPFRYANEKPISAFGNMRFSNTPNGRKMTQNKETNRPQPHTQMYNITFYCNHFFSVVLPPLLRFDYVAVSVSVSVYKRVSFLPHSFVSFSFAFAFSHKCTTHNEIEKRGKNTFDSHIHT